MREEATFRCRWERTPTGYALWIPGYPSARLEVADLTAGAEAMSEVLLKLGVATLASIELSPRPPVAEALRKFTQPELYLIIGDDPCHCGTVNSNTLLTGVPCTRCHSVSGIRNEEQLALDCLVSGDGVLPATRDIPTVSSRASLLISSPTQSVHTWSSVKSASEGAGRFSS